MSNMPSLYLALVHHPIVNKRGETITTSVTNMDLHDIARSCRTFGFKNYFIVTPIIAQHELLGKILGHWQTDTANQYNPDRFDALELIQVVSSLELAVQQITAIEGREPLVATTQAKTEQPSGDCQQLLKLAQTQQQAILLVLGTGWGLHADVINKANFRLAPIPAAADYNHLSVRSAAAIYTSRLSGVILP